MRDGDAERPVLSEMAEKLRQARGAGFYDAVPEHAPVDAPPAERPAAAAKATDDRDADAGSGSLQASMRLDSIERRLFDLRTALDEAAAEQTDMLLDPDVRAPSDAEAWIAFAAAALRTSDRAEASAEIADRLLSEYRKRRERGGMLSDAE